MRTIFLFILFGAALATSQASAPPLLQKAADKWMGERDNWAFTLKVREYDGGQVKEEREERYDPSKPGIYVVMVKWLPGGMSRPHFHPNDRFITVLKGTWWVATGTKFNPDSAVPMPAGTFVTHFGKQVHYDGAKDEETVLLITGEGPATSTPAEEK